MDVSSDQYYHFMDEFDLDPRAIVVNLEESTVVIKAAYGR